MRSHKELRVYQMAFKNAMVIFELTKQFPKKETYALADQILRSSRSVCGNIAEAFRKRKYPKSFVHALYLSQAEAAETLTWLEFAFKCNYISQKEYTALTEKYDKILGMLVTMSKQAKDWTY
jgi:four helix bundle protein